jgi:Transcriptional Coactivator p15 (PC4)
MKNATRGSLRAVTFSTSDIGYSNETVLSDQTVGTQGIPITIAKIWKSRRRDEHIRISLSEFRDRKIYDCRIWVTGRDGIDRASQRGIAASIDRLPELVAALLKAELKAKQLGWLTEASS